MTRILLVVPDRPAGWQPGAIEPFMKPAEWQSHASMCAAGLPVEVIGERNLLSGAVAKDALVVLASPPADLSDRVETHLAGTGGRLLICNDRGRKDARRGAWRARSLKGETARLRIDLRRSPRHARGGIRQRISGARPFTALRPGNGEEILARWGSRGPAALVVGRRGGLTSWRSGFPMDHLDVADMKRLFEGLGVDGMNGARPPVPGDGRAVVLLLHDVEDPVEGDRGGVRTVVAGLEACLDAQKRHGFAATYNVVGRFAETIPALVRRIAEEGHELASHGATHQVMADLEPESLQREVTGVEESVQRICGSRIRGFRSPRSRWSVPLLGCLAARGYQWNAEADPAAFPYRVPSQGAGDLLRIPVAIDDWDFVSRGSSPHKVLASWKDAVLWAVERRCWVGVGSHPSVLGIHPARMAMFSDFMAWLAGKNVVVMTHAEAAAWWRKRTQ